MILSGGFWVLGSWKILFLIFFLRTRKKRCQNKIFCDLSNFLCFFGSFRPSKKSSLNLSCCQLGLDIQYGDHVTLYYPFRQKAQLCNEQGNEINTKNTPRNQRVLDLYFKALYEYFKRIETISQSQQFPHYSLQPANINRTTKINHP